MGALLHAGVPTYARGSGWPHGRINQEDMVMCFSDDGIHLNFSESPYYNAYKAARLFLRLALVPDGRAAAWRRPSFKDAWQASLGALRPQIKGRTFEIPACGGMLMTNYADNLSDYFVPGKEIVVFDGVEDLVDKCQHYLSSQKERRAIAQAGLARVRAEHTYQQRFMQIFKELQLPL
jgi:spore maturation protein CgeB